jgi:3-hydroxy-9,10-secoandrosta-1,3,5(10)-triene-9,17-dione monooxygenase
MTVTAEANLGTRLVEQARALIPDLRGRANQTTADRRLPRETIADLRSAGAMKTLQSTANGGQGMGIRTHLDVIAALAEGCGSTAWVMGVVHAHSWLMSHASEQAQVDTYRTDPDSMISAVIGPRGVAERTADGYKLTGVWPFTSGCENSDWLLLGGMVKDGEQVVDIGDFLVPTSSMTILDDWKTVGLSGTGSCTTKVTDLAVPAHRFISLPFMVQPTAMITAAAKASQHVEWNQRMAPVPVLSIALTGSAIGVARQALADFPALIQGKTIAYTMDDQYSHPNTHRMAAEAAMLIHEGELILYHCADQIDDAAMAGEELPLLTRARMRLDCAQGVRRCLEGVEVLFKASGASGIRSSSPLTRAVADLRAVNQHGLLNLEMNQEVYGRVLLGLEPNTPLI